MKTNNSLLFLMVLFLIFLASVPLDNTTQTFLTITIIGSMWVLSKYSTHKGMRRIFYLFLGTFIVLRYLFWRIFFTLGFNDTASFIAAIILFLAELYGIYMFLLSSFVSLRPIERPKISLPDDETLLPTVDVFIPSYDENQELLVITLIAALNIKYPAKKLNVYLLDDGGTLEKRTQKNKNSAEKAIERHITLQKLCAELGVIYLTRDKNEHAKAGNMNAALPHTEGDLILILDADHVPTIDFLTHTVGHFLEDEKLFLVQTPHFFINPDPIEKNLDLYQKMPSENTMFYGAVQLGLDFWNASFFCGSAALLRRKALLDSKGFSGMTITEDAETALTLHNKGWHSRYSKYPLISGLQPETFSSFMIQRMRWAQGMIQIFIMKNPALQSGLSFAQKLSYLSTCSFWFFSIPRMIFALAPGAYLIFGLHIYNASLFDLLVYTLPYLIILVMSSDYMFGKVRWNFISNVYETMQSMYSFGAILEVLKNPTAPAFGVTPKSELLDEDFISPLSKPFYWMIALTLLIFIIGCWRFYAFPEERVLIIPALFWTTFNFIFYSASLGALLERKQRRLNPRLPANFYATLVDEKNNVNCEVWVRDISVGGASLQVDKLVDYDLFSNQFYLQGFYPVTHSHFYLPFQIREVDKNNHQQILGIQFDIEEFKNLKDIVLLVHGDSSRWEKLISQTKPDPGFSRGMYFLAKNGIIYILRYLLIIFKK